jgi:ABC-type multidrug transport system ATPase subunit
MLSRAGAETRPGAARKRTTTSSVLIQMGQNAASQTLASSLDPGPQSAPPQGRDNDARPAAGGLRLEGISKGWGEVGILDELDLAIAPGTTAWVGGQNGAGKTTLLRIVAGLLEAERGTVSFDGLSPQADRRRYQRRLGFLSAGDRGLYARLTVRQNLDLWTRLSFVPRRECQTAVQAALAQFGLEQLADARADRLSLGQRQRARLALAFGHSPRLVLLDEPANSLDDDGIALLSAALAELSATGGSGIWCSPNRPPAAEVSCGYRLERGRLAEEP